MITLPIDLQEPLTEDDLDKLGPLAESGIRFELLNGRLLMMAPMKAWHADVSARVRNVLVARGRDAYQEQGIRLSRVLVRYANVVAFRTKPDIEASRHDPSDVALVVEVLSPDSEDEDRTVKPDVYAGAGIPEYWIVDRHPTSREDATVEFFKLGVGHRYERVGSAALTELECTHGLSKVDRPPSNEHMA
jgi:Uma2 family endonuclease